MRYSCVWKTKTNRRECFKRNYFYDFKWNKLKFIFYKLLRSEQPKRKPIDPYKLYGPHGYRTYSHARCQEVPMVDVNLQDVSYIFVNWIKVQCLKEFLQVQIHQHWSQSPILPQGDLTTVAAEEWRLFVQIRWFWWKFQFFYCLFDQNH